MKKFSSASDPLWYKDAIIYELHVKAFFDSNNDGIGDFAGLIQKLDHLQDLGVTCLWLLPFFPSPLRDDGYDIADYLNIHPSYGNMEDFTVFLNGAHERGLQVIIELVVNHTSDQHPWFQAARAAPPGSPERNFYVWSDTDQAYKDARIIFTDTEKSNWTWDPVAKAYFWHRFFSHQPDLNYDNPAVIEEILRILRYWLDLGVDGVRLDAIPYLVEREGTNCENLPETHTVIRRIRSEMDAQYANRMILAEANQWPTDVRPYFGDGDECHMAFHFPLMPRIFIALRLEDRLPITDILAQTPEIPAVCQWGLFLRNHDELTLEMVSTDERDYMYLAYSGDPRMRINIGIRRRLAPLMDNNRRRVELLSSLLFSFPGTPIMYYGDEIGMGDNIYLGDRNGVRTPMQWSSDRNGGFSRANPAQLYSPLVMDPVYGYEAVNVEAQQSDSSSLLNWMRNIIALRKLFRVFGRGSLEFLNPANRKTLAYVRCYEDEQVLCVANLSRFAQPVELDLSAFEGMRPIEMLGYVEFPTIGRSPYSLSLGPYGFMWFELQKATEPIEVMELPREEFALQIQPGDWTTLLEGHDRSALETRMIPDYLSKQPWFVDGAAGVEATPIVDWVELEGARWAIVVAELQSGGDRTPTYLLPLAMSFGEAAARLRSAAPNAIVCPITSSDGDGVLHDAVYDGDACAWLLASIENHREIRTQRGVIRSAPGIAFAEARGSAESSLAPVPDSSRQNVSTVAFGDRLMLTLFRRIEDGPNPDFEIAKYLTERAHFDRVPPLAGSIEYLRGGKEPAILALLHGAPPKETDGWTWIIEELDRYFERSGPIHFPERADATRDSWFDLYAKETPALAREHFGIALDAVAMLGRRTAEMHAALAAAADDPVMTPEPVRPDHAARLAGQLRENLGSAFEALRTSLIRLPDEIVEEAALTLSRRRRFLEGVHALASFNPTGMLIRIHGDYRLERVARAKNDWVILYAMDEPCQQLRRAKESPLRDVAGIVWSLGTAIASALLNYTARRPDDFEKLAPWARLAQQSSTAELLRSYRATIEPAGLVPSEPDAFRALLRAYLLDEVLKELRRDLENNRLTSARIPLWGILSLSR